MGQTLARTSSDTGARPRPAGPSFHRRSDWLNLVQGQSGFLQQHVGGTANVLNLIGQIHGAISRAPSFAWDLSRLMLPTITEPKSSDAGSLPAFRAPSSMNCRE